MMAASTTDQSISVAVQVDLINGIDEKRECVYKYFTLLPRSLRICHSNVFLVHRGYRYTGRHKQTLLRYTRLHPCYAVFQNFYLFILKSTWP